MTAAFNAEEIFELAVQIERYGERFYRLAAQRVGDEKARALLADLARYEEQHVQTFQALREAAAAAPGVDLADLDDTAGEYLRAMANGVVFEVDGDPAGRLRGDETLEQLLRIALQLEHASIAFYTGIQRAMPATWGPDKIEAILREEMTHVTYIAGALAQRHGARP